MANSLMQNSIIQGVYSTSPRNATDPRSTFKILISNELLNDHHTILQNRMHIVMYYNKPSEGSGFDVAGWIKESLGKALDEHPVLAGRFRSTGDGGLEIVSNDSGVRCVEVQMQVSLEDFLRSQVDETQLVYWKDIDQTNPQFSPLFYIQVTNFQCGGYTVGISYNLLLADPLVMASFLKKWANIHASMAYESEDSSKTPLFNTLNLKQNGCSLSATPATSNANTLDSETIVYKISTAEQINPGDDTLKFFVQLCLEEANIKLTTNKINSNFALIIKEPNGDTKVEQQSFKQGNFGLPESLKYELNLYSLEELKLSELVFQKGNKGVRISKWIACDATEGVVLTTISYPSDGKSTIMVYITIVPGSKKTNQDQ